jgi:hypothetical protein
MEVKLLDNTQLAYKVDINDVDNLRDIKYTISLSDVSINAMIDMIQYGDTEMRFNNIEWTVDASTLQNYLNVYTQYRQPEDSLYTARAVYQCLPQEHDYLFKPYV